MGVISQKRKIISIVLKLIVVVCAAVGTFMSAYAGRGSFMGGNRVFMFFTIQSNILIALMCVVGAWLLARNKTISSTWYTVKLVGTVSITLTGVVFAVLLAPILGKNAWNFQNTLTHVVVPIAAVLDFFVVAPLAEIKKKSVIFVIIPPLLYAIYAGIGYVRGWEFAKGQIYPYFFLNWGSPAGAVGFVNEFPYMGCVWYILALLIFLIIVGLCYVVIANPIRKHYLKLDER